MPPITMGLAAGGLADSESECTRRAGALLAKLACGLSRCGDLQDPFCGQLAHLRRVRCYS